MSSSTTNVVVAKAGQPKGDPTGQSVGQTSLAIFTSL